MDGSFICIISKGLCLQFYQYKKNTTGRSIFDCVKLDLVLVIVLKEKVNCTCIHTNYQRTPNECQLMRVLKEVNDKVNGLHYTL